jgi:hypothetical protein
MMATKNSGYEWTAEQRAATSKRVKAYMKKHPQKWTPERHKKFSATMAARSAAKKKEHAENIAKGLKARKVAGKPDKANNKIWTSEHRANFVKARTGLKYGKNGHPWTDEQHKNFAASVAARKAAGLPGNGHPANGNGSAVELPALVGSFPLDAIPARAEKKVYAKRIHSADDDARVRLVLELVKLAQQVL